MTLVLALKLTLPFLLGLEGVELRFELRYCFFLFFRVTLNMQDSSACVVRDDNQDGGIKGKSILQDSSCFE